MSGRFLQVEAELWESLVSRVTALESEVLHQKRQLSERQLRIQELETASSSPSSSSALPATARPVANLQGPSGAVSLGPADASAISFAYTIDISALINIKSHAISKGHLIYKLQAIAGLHQAIAHVLAIVFFPLRVKEYWDKEDTGPLTPEQIDIVRKTLTREQQIYLPIGDGDKDLTDGAANVVPAALAAVAARKGRQAPQQVLKDDSEDELATENERAYDDPTERSVADASISPTISRASHPISSENSRSTPITTPETSIRARSNTHEPISRDVSLLPFDSSEQPLSTGSSLFLGGQDHDIASGIESWSEADIGQPSELPINAESSTDSAMASPPGSTVFTSSMPRRPPAMPNARAVASRIASRRLVSSSDLSFSAAYSVKMEERVQETSIPKETLKRKDRSDTGDRVPSEQISGGQSSTNTHGKKASSTGRGPKASSDWGWLTKS